MKRLALALVVLGVVACKKGEEAQPAADTTATAAPAAPMMDTSTMMGDTSKMMMGDTAKMGGEMKKQD